MRAAWAELFGGQRKRWWLGGAALLAFVLVFWRDAISERLVPDPGMNRKLESAQAALRRGELTSSDGSGARELYESVLAMDPDQMQARQGLVDVRNAAIADAQRALAQRQLGLAAADLALARELSAPAVQLQALGSRLRDLEEASSDIPGLLAQAAAPGVSDEQAFALLEQVLSLDAGNAEAVEGRRDLLSRWLLRAEQMIRDGQVEQARALVAEVVAVDPGHLDLPPVQAELGEALAHWQGAQNRTLADAEAEERAGRIEHAAQLYLRVVREGDAQARVDDALQRLAATMARQAERQAADFEFARAETSLAKAQRWSPGSPAVRAAAEAVDQSRTTQKRLVHSPRVGAGRELPALLEAAKAAMARGDFISPPVTSAWDKLRVASAIAPGSPEVHAVQMEFATRSQACFEDAMTASHLKRAQLCLEAFLSVQPLSADAGEAKGLLAGRWLAYAEERIGASDYVEAEKALAAAQRWQPANPSLKTTARRLERARGRTK